VPGPHLSEPSPQRTPVLFQAGTSEPGREFAARNAEAIFIIARNAEGARAQTSDVRARAVRHGRDPGDVLFFQALSVIVGGTEEEARRKEVEIEEHASDDGYAAHMAGNIGVDLADIDLEAPLTELPERYAGQSMMNVLVESAPDKSWAFGDLLRWIASVRVVGTPEQVADELQVYADAGVDGINLMYYTTPGSFEDFIDGVTPVLQERGLQQREYGPGTLREKLSDGASGPRISERHPAAGYRRREPVAA
jgi:long-chain alkane monooxygenase